MDEAFLTVAEVAALLRLNQQTVRNWIDQGSLPAVRVGRRVRVRQADLERFVSAGAMPREQPTEPADTAAALDEQAQERCWAELYRQLGKLHAAKARDKHAAMLAALRSLSEAAASLADALEQTPRSPTPIATVAAAEIRDAGEP